MDTNEPTHAIRLTPPGRAAIASVAVRGPAATRLVQRLFHPASGRAFEDFPLGRIVFGRWIGDSPDCGESGDFSAGEEVVVARLSETNIEVHCHGGHAAVGAIVRDLCTAGAVPRAWDEPAVAWDELTGPAAGGAATESNADGPADDPLQNAARIALAQARTERTAAILLDQYHGALSREVQQLKELLQAGDLAEAERRIDQLLDRAPLGLRLTEPWKIVLAGPANVGKSTLINAIVGYQRAITYAQPGTTRDVVTATTAIDGWPVELSDTAGLRATDDPIEADGVARAKSQLASADLRLLVFDLSEPWTESQQQLVEAWPDAMLIHNKSDLADAFMGDRPSGFSISAETRSGVDQLLTAVAEQLVSTHLADGDPLPFTREQVRALEGARGQLSKDVAKAIEHLGMLSPSP